MRKNPCAALSADVVGQVLDLEALLLRLELDDVADRDDTHHVAALDRSLLPCLLASGEHGIAASRDGRPHRADSRLVASLERGWIEYLSQLVREAQRLGELQRTSTRHSSPSKIDACLELTNYHYVLFRDSEIMRRGRGAIVAVLERVRERAERA